MGTAAESHPGLFLVHGELLLLDGLQLIAEVELGRLLLELGELVLVFGDLLQGWLDAGKHKRQKAFPVVIQWSPAIKSTSAFRFLNFRLKDFLKRP